VGKSGGAAPSYFPLPHVVLVRFDWDEPPPFDEDSRQAQDRISVPNGVGSVSIDIPRSDSGFGPVIYEPIQERFK
jgi:hypothetical protein